MSTKLQAVESLTIAIDDKARLVLQQAYVDLTENQKLLELQAQKVEARRNGFNALVYRHMLDADVPKNYRLNVETWMFEETKQASPPDDGEDILLGRGNK